MKKKVTIISLSSVLAIAVIALVAYYIYITPTLPKGAKPGEFELFIPELVELEDNETFEMTVDKTEFEFFEGYTTGTMSYNQQGYLGKTYKFTKGELYNAKVTNNLDDITTVHWHGLEVVSTSDGIGMAGTVQPGSNKTFPLSIEQQAATLWYHPHPKGYTAAQAYNGLAGIVIIEDENDYGLPTDYGINDIPLVLQAKQFDRKGQLVSTIMDPNMAGGDEEGDGDFGFADGDGSNKSTTHNHVILSNGHYVPTFTVRNEVVRFRTLNGSNHGILDIKSDASLKLVGTDGGLLEAAQDKSTISLAAGERGEILLDLTDKSNGDKVTITANGQDVLTITIDTELHSSISKVNQIPEKIGTIIPYEEYTNQAVDTRYTLEDEQINGKSFDMNRIDETYSFYNETTKENVYYFEVENTGDENHSFHMHNTQFLIVEKNGSSVDYKDYGFKDTIYLKPGESYKIQAAFKHGGIYMYHCHILAHEESGMMGRFEVK